MPSEQFRIALIFTPTKKVAIGITTGDYEAGCKFIAQIRPLIDQFLNQVRGEYVGARRKHDKNVSSSESENEHA